MICTKSRQDIKEKKKMNYTNLLNLHLTLLNNKKSIESVKMYILITV